MTPRILRLDRHGRAPDGPRRLALLHEGAPRPEEARRARWRGGMLGFDHHGSAAHEVLAVWRGAARLRLGDPAGEAVAVAAGDVLPAGAGRAASWRRTPASGWWGPTSPARSGTSAARHPRPPRSRASRRSPSRCPTPWRTPRASGPAFGEGPPVARAARRPSEGDARAPTRALGGRPVASRGAPGPDGARGRP